MGDTIFYLSLLTMCVTQEVQKDSISQYFRMASKYVPIVLPKNESCWNVNQGPDKTHTGHKRPNNKYLV